jgi:hypothetical protein
MKECKECPWKIRNKHNDSIIEFSKRIDKPHNCHMSKNGGGKLWEVNDETKCQGRLNYEKKNSQLE